MAFRTLDLELAFLRLHLALLPRPDLADDLLARAGSPECVFQHLGAALDSAGEPLPPAVAGRLRDGAFEGLARREVEICRRAGVTILRRGGPGWPHLFAGLPGMPLVLFARGAIEDQDQRSIGMVGSRRPTPYGLRQAGQFARGLAARGITVVSGLARGIDGESHRAALEAGGRSIGVLGSGLGRIYPAEHASLARRVETQGAIVTEFPWATPPLKHHFPHRNRILSALSRGVLVVEAGERSGSLITADWAAEQDRPVFVVPSRVDSVEALGGLRLLQDGAQVVLDADDVAAAAGLGDLAASRSAVRGMPGDGLPEELAALFQEEDVWTLEEIAARLGRPLPGVMAMLVGLEDAALVRRVETGGFARA